MLLGSLIQMFQEIPFAAAQPKMEPFYVVGTPENAIAGDDLRVLVARVTTCGDWSLNMDVQVFPEGNQSAVDLYFLDADGEGTIEVIDPCDGYALGQAEVEGNVISCARDLWQTFPCKCLAWMLTTPFINWFLQLTILKLNRW